MNNTPRTFGRTQNNEDMKSIKLLFLPALLALLMMTTTGCNTCWDCPTAPPPPPPPAPCWGSNGIDGSAFLALDYSFVEPGYIWGNNPAIPDIFSYGVNYLSPPGEFQLYYEGEFMDGCCPVEYYWDINYSIWINGGTPGDCYANGLNGADSFLRIFMDPYEPGFERINKQETGLEIKYLEKTDTKIIVEVKNDHFTMRVEYTKLTESRKDELMKLKK